MNQEILNTIRQNPEVQAAVNEAIQGLLEDPDVTVESVEALIRSLEFVLQNPDSYDDFVQAAVQSQVIDREDLPEQFDPTALTVILIALKFVQQQQQQPSEAVPGFAKGGLNSLASMGRGGDSELAHINPFEQRVLESYGGSGTINPQTGLREFSWKKKFKKLFRVLAPIALNFLAPGLGTTIGGFLGASGTAATMLGSAVIGGATAGLTGGNVLKGALGGALGAGAGSALGGTVNSALGTSLSQGTQNIIGGSLIGGAQSALSGEGFVKGLAQGAIGSSLGNTLSGAASGIDGKLGAGLQTASTQFGNALTMGEKPRDALAQGALSGLAASFATPKPVPNPVKSIYDISPDTAGNTGFKLPSDPTGNMGFKLPSDMAIDGLTGSSGQTGIDYSLAGRTQMPSGQPFEGTGLKVSPLNTIAAQSSMPAASSSAKPNTGFNLGTAAQMLPLLSLFSSAKTPEEVQQVVSRMSPEQQEYFNRPMRNWNYDEIGAAAKTQGLDIGSYIARNWDKVGGGMYDAPDPVKLSRGGALSMLAQGGGTGRSDSISAMLSDGEYVMDAETVALLGDGSTKAGANQLDKMRAKIRQHKGKSMAKGKFSANAKSPLAYLKERV